MINTHNVELPMLTPLEEVMLPTKFGKFDMYAFDSGMEYSPHIAMVKQNTAMDREPLLRIHSECITGDLLGSLTCDCGLQFDQVMHRISLEDEGGILIYLRQEGRGIGILNKMRAYRMQQEKNMDTEQANIALGFESDLRKYEVALDILRFLNVTKVRLMTNNPLKLNVFEGSGIACQRVPIHTAKTPYNKGYLETKYKKMNHFSDC